MKKQSIFRWNVFLTGAVIALFISPGNSSEVMKITGTVIDSISQKPLANTKVWLADIPTVQDTTDSAGNFAMVEWSTNAHLPANPASLSPSISINGRTLSILGRGHEGAASFEIFNARGVRVYSKQIELRNQPRNEFIYPSQLPGFQYVMIRTNGTVLVSTRFDSDLRVAMNSQSTAPLASRLTKRFSLHTLKVSRIGYFAKQVAIDSEFATVDTVQLFSPANAMKTIPAGTFSMGESWIADSVHQVTLSAFAMASTHVTQGQYLAVMGVNPSHFTGDLNRPVESITWFNAVRYCNTLSTLVGYDMAYDTITWVLDTSKNGFRLPTEAQWEYACRAGTTTEYWWGADTAGMGACTWSIYNSDSTTHPVASKSANAFGLYDITGNVWQWCNDWYECYGSSAQTNPRGPATGTQRVLRGGSWGYDDFRCATRDASDPNAYDDKDGLRCVLPR
jgi:formylglycine-generating enzyme required for sulfatase activity